MAMTKRFKKLPKAAKRAAFAAMDADSGKTKITTANKAKIAAGFKNPDGMMFKNTPSVRAAVASEAHSILRKLQGKK